MRTLTILLAAVFVATHIPSRAAAQTIHTGPDGRYTLVVPEGMSRMPSNNLSAAFDAVFQQPSTTASAKFVRLMLQSVPSEVRDEPPTDELLDEVVASTPGGVSARSTTITWDESIIDVVEVMQETDGVQAFIIMAVIPVRVNALQVIVTGPAGDLATGRDLLAKVVPTINAQNSWTAAPSKWSVVRVLMIDALIVIGGLIVAILIRPRISRGLLLVLGLLLIPGGQILAGWERFVFVQVFAGTLSVLGGCVFVLGIIDLCVPRRNKKKPPVARRARPGAALTHPEPQASPAAPVPSPPCPDDPS